MFCTPTNLKPRFEITAAAVAPARAVHRRDKGGCVVIKRIVPTGWQFHNVDVRSREKGPHPVVSSDAVPGAQNHTDQHYLWQLEHGAQQVPVGGIVITMIELLCSGATDERAKLQKSTATILVRTYS